MKDISTQSIKTTLNKLEGCDCVLSRDKIIHLLRLGLTEYEIQCAIREVVLEKMNKETDNG